MRQRRPSIEDIARAAGVANSTVSRALRGSPLISAAMRATIQRIADDMGYMPNGIARSLQTQRTNTVGLVVTTIADPFFADVAKGVEAGAHAAGMSVFLSASHHDAARELAVIETFQHRRVDGIIVADSRIGGQHRALLQRARIPAVLINNQTEQPPALLHSVAVDDYNGARMAVQHLLHLGHRAIGYGGAGNRPMSNRRRMEGYRDALRAAGVEPDPAWTVAAPDEHAPHEDDLAAGQALLAPLLRAGISAIFCYNDIMAIGVLMACRAAGVAVPQTLSVVGFDDIAAAQYVSPPLSTVHQPKIALGATAMAMLLALLGGEPVQNRVLVPTFITRESTARVGDGRWEMGDGEE